MKFAIISKREIKGALAKIFVEKILCLKLKKDSDLSFMIEYVILKKKPLIKKTFPSECILNRVSIYFCLQANKICSLSE